MAATGFTAAAMTLRLAGTELILGLAGCSLLMVLLELARRSELPVSWFGIVPALSLAFCGALGAGVAALEGHGGLLFLPCLFLLGTVSILIRRGFLVACSVLVAAGFLFPAIMSGSVGWSQPAAAVALVVLPLVFQHAARALATGNGEVIDPGPDPALVSDRLTPRQREVTVLLAHGFRHGEIAERLDVSVHQVRRLVRQARERVGARTTAELVATTVSSDSLSQAESVMNTPN